MRIIRDDHVPANSGWGAEMAAGDVLRITAMTIVDFVCLDRADPRHRFDQAQTKRANMKIWISTGDALVAKSGRTMMTILADGFAGTGRHDLQYGMCSGPRYARARDEGRLDQYHHGDDIAVPDHGCWENLQDALTPWGVAREHIPSPLNLFQHVEIDTRTGAIRHSPVRPAAPAAVDLRAEMDLILAASACPDLAAPRFGQPIRAMIYRP